LRFGGDPTGLLVGPAKYRRALGTQGVSQRHLVKGGIGNAALGLNELILHLANPGFEVSDFSGDGL
jgi:hypothetical protein